jgi:protein O-GlcNAcase/histone acetyltransferase
MQVEMDGHGHPIVINGTQMIVENDSEHRENHNDDHENVDESNEDTHYMKNIDKQLTHEDLSLLCDLFYLPFEHGGQGIQFLQEFNWLKSNAHIVIYKSKEDESIAKADVSNIILNGGFYYIFLNTIYVFKYLFFVNRF